MLRANVTTTKQWEHTINGSTIVGVSVLNFERGGLTNGEYHFSDCAAALAARPDYCDLVILGEAKEYALRGGAGKYGFTNALAAAAKRPLVCELGTIPRGQFGPMLVYDPTVLGVTTFQDTVLRCRTRTKSTSATCTLRATGAQLGVLPVLWTCQSPGRRFWEAEMMSWVAGVGYPVLVAGDFNGVATGGNREPVPNYAAVPPHKRYHKARWVPGQAEITESNTDALDFLLGSWDSRLGHRVGGIGMLDLAEIAFYSYGEQYALRTTVNPQAGSSGQRIDRGLVNPAGRDLLVPRSFQVEPPPSGLITFSDHRIVRFKLDLSKAIAC